MKNTFSFRFLFLFYICGSIISYAQLEEKETNEACKQISYIKSKPISYWLETLSTNSPGGRQYSLDALAKLGPEAAEAVPTLAKLVNDKDWMVQRKVFEALVKIADGDDTSPAALMLIQALAKSNQRNSAREYALRGLSEIYNTRRLVGTTQLPGWVGVYPSDRIHFFWDKPVVSADGKSYSQQFSEAYVGSISSMRRTETLARDPLFAQKYSDEALRKDPNPPKIYYAGKRKVLIWDLKEKVQQRYIQPCETIKSRTIVLLNIDKAWISEICFDTAYGERAKAEPTEFEFSDEQLVFFDRAEAALENPPRTNFRRTSELFKPLKKGMSQFDVYSYVGKPDQVFPTGEGMAVAVYGLLNESTIVLRYSNPSKTVKQFSEGGLWKLEYANLTPKDNNPIIEFIR